ncbi:hypothetical protein [Fibrivirga algicola]|uniref:Uncharacterized protein n=1 Tax=Fibrivirga algicola TaxID=2950420 RepID=A0ABX0QMT9_9BACT|nr:hypothetical protein [Fibrivirga algicola]NID13775.1 hypothetical protein [Fibrivirga algicola]
MDNHSEIEASIMALSQTAQLLNVSLIQSDGAAAVNINTALAQIEVVLQRLQRMKDNGQTIDPPTKTDVNKALDVVGWIIKTADIVTRILDT